jgi:hypothetical protein
MSSWCHWLFCLAALPCLAGAAEKSTAVINDVAYTKPQKLVAVESGRRLNIYCTGVGSPTVVFESGLGEATVAWGRFRVHVIVTRSMLWSWNGASCRVGCGRGFLSRRMFGSPALTRFAPRIGRSVPFRSLF